MNKIDLLFTKKREGVLNIYFTAGYPKAGDTPLIIRSLEKSGADLIEIGIPFSDPVADGPVIQQSSHQALLNGMNPDLLFEQLEAVAKEVKIPIILMGYYNSFYQYGMERFVGRCLSAGVSGVIIPDLPPEIYESKYKNLFENAGLHFICLVSPDTPPERVAYLASLSKGFLYILSSSSTTGNTPNSIQDNHPDTLRYRDFASLNFNHFNHLNHLNHFPPPTLIGFGIHNRETFEWACQHANGAIVGSQFIRELNRLDDSDHNREERMLSLCNEFVQNLRPRK